jgi:hypothetical protein
LRLLYHIWLISQQSHYIETARGAFIGAIIGGTLFSTVPTVLCNLFELKSFTLKIIFAGGVVIGGSFGLYTGQKIVHDDMEQEEFWHEVIKCSHDIPSLEISGALSAEEVN